MAADAVKSINLRLPEAMHSELVALAEEDLRSLQAEIIILLREAMERRTLQKRRRAFEALDKNSEENSEEITTGHDLALVD